MINEPFYTNEHGTEFYCFDLLKFEKYEHTVEIEETKDQLLTGKTVSFSTKYLVSPVEKQIIGHTFKYKNRVEIVQRWFGDYRVRADVDNTLVETEDQAIELAQTMLKILDNSKSGNVRFLKMKEYLTELEYLNK